MTRGLIQPRTAFDVELSRLCEVRQSVSMSTEDSPSPHIVTPSTEDEGIDGAESQARRWPRGINLAWYSIVSGAVVLSLVSTSVPGGYFFLQMALLYGWAVLLAVTLLAYLISAARRRTPKPRLAHAVPVIAFIVTVGLSLVQAPLLAGFFISSSAMNDLVRDAKRDPNSFDKPTRVGVWPVERAESYKGGVRFLVKGTGFLDPGGFAYSENGKPPNIGGEDYYEHLHGNWYVWTESW